MPTALAGRGTGIGALVIAPSSTLYAWSHVAAAIFTSTDGGDHWTTPVHPPQFRSISRLVVDTADSSVVYAADRANGILKSSDGGRNFSRQGELGDATVLAIDPTNTATIYAGTTRSTRSIRCRVCTP